MRRFPVLFFVAVSFLKSGFSSADIRENCTQDVLCITCVERDDTVDVLLENRRLFDITVTIDFQPDNMVVIDSPPFTQTYPCTSITKAYTLSVVDTGSAWRYSCEYTWTKGNIHVIHDSTYVYSLPYERGKTYRVLQGYRGRFSHSGENEYAVDFRMGTGSTVCAARSGVVVDIKEDSESGGTEERNEKDANYVIIRHNDGTLGEYYHLEYQGVLVSLGQEIEAGTPIALSGNTGYSTNPHLHFGVYSAVDGNTRKSHPLLFRTTEGILNILTEGNSYRSP